MLRGLRQGQGQRLLWLPDWSARCEAASASVECIRAYYELFLPLGAI